MAAKSRIVTLLVLTISWLGLGLAGDGHAATWHFSPAGSDTRGNGSSQGGFGSGLAFLHRLAPRSNRSRASSRPVVTTLVTTEGYRY